MKKIAFLFLCSLVLFGCDAESSLVDNSVNQDDSSSASNGTNTLYNSGPAISFKVTPDIGDTLSMCDTVTITFSAKVIPTEDEYGNSSFTRYNGPAHALVNANSSSATYVYASNIYDNETNTLKIFFPSTEVYSASNEVQNIAIDVIPQYMHGVNGEKINIPSVGPNGGYAVVYHYQEKTSCSTNEQ